MPIFRSDLNNLLALLLREDFTAKGFEVDQDLTATGLIVELPLRITHKPSAFYFNISSLGASYRVSCLPGSKPQVVHVNVSNWTEVLTRCKAWIARVIREVEQPDPWSLLNQGKVLTDELPGAGQGLEKLDPLQLKSVEAFVQSIKDYITREVNPTEDQLRTIDQKLNYLIESAKRQSKQDWAHTAIGVVVTIAIGLAMAPDQANNLFQMTSGFIKTLFVHLLT